MRWTLALVVVLAGCDLFGPEVLFVNRRPVPPHMTGPYTMWYAAVEECLGAEGDFSAVRWFTADTIRWDGRLVTGSISGDEVTIHRDHLWSLTVPHEMVHHITGRGEVLHDADGRVPCEVMLVVS